MGEAFAGSRIEQDDPSIVYIGTWYPNGESPLSGGSATLTNAKEAGAVLTFTGTGVTWIGTAAPYSGLAQIYLDGLPSTIDTYAENTSYQQNLFSVHDLAAGPHTLSIQVLHQRGVNTSGSWVWIDAFEIDNGSAISGGVSATGGRVGQNDASVSYTGNWFLNSNPVQSGGTAILSTDRGSHATLSFTGTGVKWIAYKDQWSGLANVYLDGALKGEIDTHASSDQAHGEAFAVQGLPAGAHTLSIEVKGTHSPASGGSWIWVDAFDVLP